MALIVEAALGGRSKNLGIWTQPTDGPFAPAHRLVMDAKRVVEGHFQAAQIIRGDVRRSALAQADDMRQDAAGRLKEVGALQVALARERAALDARAAALSAVAPYRDGDFATVQIDLALASHIAAMEPANRTASLLMGSDQRLVDAVLRLPSHLSRISAELHSKIEAEAIARQHPGEASAIESLREAHASVQHVLRSAWTVLASASGASLDEQVSAAGGNDGAKELMPQKASPATLERIAARLSGARQEFGSAAVA